MPFKGKNYTAPKSSQKKNSCLNLFACFRCPQVDDPDDSLHASAVAVHRSKTRLPWLPWSKCKRKKKKMKTTIPFDLQCATSNLSFVASSNSTTSTPKSRNSNGWCKRKHKTPMEALPDQGAPPSRTASMDLMDRFAPFPPGPRSTTSQINQPIRPDLLRHVVHHTAANQIIGRIGGRRLRLGAGLWVMVTSLGVMLVFGRTGAVLFLSSCWYIVPLVIDTLLSNERRGN